MTDELRDYSYRLHAVLYHQREIEIQQRLLEKAIKSLELAEKQVKRRMVEKSENIGKTVASEQAL